jgi:hypothetical protein
MPGSTHDELGMWAGFVLLLGGVRRSYAQHLVVMHEGIASWSVRCRPFDRLDA